MSSRELDKSALLFQSLGRNLEYLGFHQIAKPLSGGMTMLGWHVSINRNKEVPDRGLPMINIGGLGLISQSQGD